MDWKNDHKKITSAHVTKTCEGSQSNKCTQNITI